MDDGLANAMAERFGAETHQIRHGGVFVCGEIMGVFLNMGDDPAIIVSVLSEVDERGFDTHGEGRTADRYSWALIVEAPGETDRLLEAVIAAVGKLRPNYPMMHFGIVID